jgi:hypothetical protein
MWAKNKILPTSQKATGIRTVNLVALYQQVFVNLKVLPIVLRLAIQPFIKL